MGSLHCKVCGQDFQTGVNHLSAAVDVYSDWVDACEDVAQEAAAAEALDGREPVPSRSAPRPRRIEDDEDDEDDELEGEKDYEDE